MTFFSIFSGHTVIVTQTVLSSNLVDKISESFFQNLKNLIIMSDWEDNDGPETQQNAKLALQEFLNPGGTVNNNYQTGSSGSGGKTGNGYKRNMTFDTTMTLSIPKSDVGRLIGRGGSHIKELRQATGCQVLF